MSDMKAVNPICYRTAEAYDQKRGSGWFWCQTKNGDWIACYINALWGASVDGIYISPHNFVDVFGPIAPPEPTDGKGATK